jgi:hypothetical protein
LAWLASSIAGIAWFARLRACAVHSVDRPNDGRSLIVGNAKRPHELPGELAELFGAGPV